MTDAEMDSVEKMATRFIEITVKGVRADYFRKTLKKHRIETGLEEITEADELALSHTYAVCGHCAGCQNERLCLALEELTQRQRFVIVRIYKEKYTEEEVAQMLGVTQQAVHFHKNKALARLRNLLQKR